MRYKLQSVDVLSVAKVAACLYGCLALVFVPVFLIIGIIGGIAGGKEGAIGAIGMIVLAVLMPFIYAGFGFIFGALFAWLYNVLAKRVGAIELRLDLVASAPVSKAAVV